MVIGVVCHLMLKFISKGREMVDERTRVFLVGGDRFPRQ